MWGLVTPLLLLLGFLNSAEADLEVLEVDWNISTPNAVALDLKIVQPTRGIFGVSGDVDFTQDINTDTTLVEVKVYCSSNGISYQLSPQRIPQQSFTNGLNTSYKQYLMERMVECCENATNGDTFVSPLTKRLIKCENCLFPSDNFPPTLRVGFYRLVIMTYDGLGMNISLLLKLNLA